MTKYISILILVFLFGCAEAEKETETDTAKSTVLAMYGAFAAGDIPTVKQLMAEGIVWNEAENFPYADGNPYIGVDAIFEGVFARIGADWSSWVVRKGRVFSAGDMVVVEGYYDGTVAATGEKYAIQMVHIWQVKDGKIIHFQQYADTLKSTQAIAKKE